MDAENAKNILKEFFLKEGGDVIQIHKSTYGIDNANMEKIFNGYVEYMVIKAFASDDGLDSGAMKLSASNEVDALWHSHILCTNNYKEFMKCINEINPLVDFIHHSLSGSRDSESAKTERRLKTRSAHTKLFKTECKWISEDGKCEESRAVKKEDDEERQNTIDFSYINVIIRKSTGDRREIPLNVRRISTSLHVKALIQQMEGTPTDQQRLIFGGRQIVDERTLQEYGVQENDVIDMVLRLSGC